MQTITILCVGKIKEKYFTDAIAEYQKRLGRYCKLNIIEVPDEATPDHPSPKEKALILEKEGERIFKKIPSSSHVTALCIEGNELSSPELSENLAALAASGVSHRVFIIGGSLGLSDNVKARADLKLSFSPMTFPHQLMRVILLEQLYRALNLAGGGKYHK